MQTYIYGLYCPVAKTIRYVGKSDDPAKRLRLHIDRARSGITKHHCARWINRLLTAGLEPQLAILATVPHDQCWQDAERKFIADGPTLGWKLTNVTKGGEGVVGIGQEALSRRVASWRRTFSNPELKARQSAALKNTNSRPDVIERRSASAKAAWDDPEIRARYMAANLRDDTRKRRSIASMERASDQAFVARHSAAMKAAFASPEARAAQSLRSKLSHTNPEVEARRNASIKAAHKKPEVKARLAAAMLVINARPDVRAAKSAASVASWADPEKRAARMTRMNDPAVKAKHLAGIMAALERSRAEKLNT